MKYIILPILHLLIMILFVITVIIQWVILSIWRFEFNPSFKKVWLQNFYTWMIENVINLPSLFDKPTTK